MIGKMRLTFVFDDATALEASEAAGAVTLMDEEEFRAFYERTSRPLWAYLSRITGNRQEADDILQETYYRFYRAAAAYENETHRRNSLFRIATNVARDAARRAKHRSVVPLDDEGINAPAPRNLGPERQAQIRTDLARALEQLEPVQRELLWLAYAQGASHEEIAEIVGMKSISIRTVLLRARRKLARLLNGDER